MFKGPQNHQVFPGDSFDIRSDQEVSLYGLIKGKREHVFPIPTHMRRGFIIIPDLVTQVEVKTAKSTNYTVAIKPNNDGKEYLDQTPIEIGIDQKRPPSLQEEMKRFITEEVSRQAETTGHESFEEADDFDISQDEFQTQYTLQEMQEEEPIDPGLPSEPQVGAPPDATLAPNPEDTTPNPPKETDSTPATPAITSPIPPVKP